MRRSTLAAGVSILALAAGFVTAPASAHRDRERGPDVVADGLIGPLTLAVGDRGSVYLTQSFAGTLTKVDRRGRLSDVHQLATPEAGELVGVATHRGATYHVETDFSGELPTSHIVRTSPRGTRTVVSENLWAHEVANNPDASQHYGFQGLDAQCAAEVAVVEETVGFPLDDYPGIVESHAYQLDVHRGSIYVADAAANAVLRVSPRTGRVSTVAVLPGTSQTMTPELLALVEERLFEGMELPDCLVGHEFVSEPVPTDVQVARDGSLYVSTLGGGVGELVPQSYVYRVTPWDGRVREVAEGLHGATGLALSRSGIVVAQMFGGEVSLLRQHRRHTHVDTLFTADSPADVAVDGRTLYATTGAMGENGALVTYRLRGH